MQNSDIVFPNLPDAQGAMNSDAELLRYYMEKIHILELQREPMVRYRDMIENGAAVPPSVNRWTLDDYNYMIDSTTMEILMMRGQMGIVERKIQAADPHICRCGLPRPEKHVPASTSVS